MTDDTMMKISDVAKQTNSDKRTVISWIKGGHLKAKRLPSGHWRIHRSDLVAFLAPDARGTEAARD